MRIFVMGPSGDLGGAQTEVWDTVRLWRGRGLAVHVLASAANPPSWRERLATLGCTVFDVERSPLNAIRGVAGEVVVGICDSTFLERAQELRDLGCQRVWVNCMNWMFPQEGFHYESSGCFEAYVYQSQFQRGQLEPVLGRFGYRAEQGHLIRGAFDVLTWPWRSPRRASTEEFVIGRLARPDAGKWSRRTWEIFGRIDHPLRQAMVMGVDDTIRKWLGPPPRWAEVLPPCAMPAQDFYLQVHCLMPINFSALENWPRIGLEAMACGVPIVAPRQGGWCEMIEHGETGFLASSPEEFGRYGTLLARDESLRLRIAAQARHKLETELGNPDLIWTGWKRLFASLGAEVP